ncbi:MAG: hypothetical protein FJ100_19770 [Deltaproteobacteria bacterium]|nr:hypothetical protein [Deltaproteobacteria bacterium]
MHHAMTRAALACALAACSDPQPAQPVGAADAIGNLDAFGSAPLDAKAGDGGVADTGADSGAAETDAEIDGDTAADQAGSVQADAADAKGGFNYPCKPLTVEACVTACGSAGKRTCLKDWGPCVPPLEWCGNCADDDCNGLVNEGCPANPTCAPPSKACPTAHITIAEGSKVGTGTVLHLSAAGSFAPDGKQIVQWAWAVSAPAGSTAKFQPGTSAKAPTLTVDVAGTWQVTLQVWDDKGLQSCATALATVQVDPYPPVSASPGCADGQREGFADSAQWPQIAGCSGAWDQPGITPNTVQATCGNQGGDDGAKADGKGCSSADLCAPGWHVCKGWQEVAQKSPTGCAGATPADAKPKSLFFAIRQPSVNGSVCGAWGEGFNDVFGCGNLGTGLGPDKNCGPLDRVLASTQPNSCGFNEAEPNLGPWQCLGTGKSDLNEGANVTKKACQGKTCSYDGAPLGPSDKGGVLCCAGP